MNAQKAWIRLPLAVACGHWGWPVRDFWNTTPLEMKSIIEGLTELHARTQPQAFDAHVVEELRHLLDQQQRKN